MVEKEYIEKEATIKRFTFATLDCLGMEPQIRASDVVRAIYAIPAADVVEVRWGVDAPSVVKSFVEEMENENEQ